MNPTDPVRLREGIEKAERESLPWEGSWPVDEGGRVYNQGAYIEVASTVVGSTAEYIVHAANDYPALARAHLELLEGVATLDESHKATAAALEAEEDATDEARAQVQRLEEALRLLWAEASSELDPCPVCCGYRSEGHENTCLVAAALAAGSATETKEKENA